MRIEKISSVYGQNYLNNSNKKSGYKFQTHPAINELPNVNSAYFNINFSGSYEKANLKKFSKNREKFTLIANNTWNKTRYIAKKFNHSQITSEHLYVVVLNDLIKYIDKLNFGVRREEEKQYSAPVTLEAFFGRREIFEDKEARTKLKEILEKYLKEGLRDLKNNDRIPKAGIFEPRLSPRLAADLNKGFEVKESTYETGLFSDDVFLLALLAGSDNKIVKKFREMDFEVQKATMVEDNSVNQKNHLPFYDNLADKLWKNIDLGNDMYITYEGENKESSKHLISSFTNLINKPNQKYNNLNAQNTKIVVFNQYGIYSAIENYVEEAKKHPETTYVLMYDFADVAKSNALAEERAEIGLNENELKLLENSQVPNVRMVMISNKDAYYANAQQSPIIKKRLAHYGVLSIPMINSSDAKEILASENGKKYIEKRINKEIDLQAISQVIDFTNKTEGYYPEKALSYVDKMASYYIDKKQLTFEDVQSYEKEIGDIQQKSDSSQSDFKITFNTGKNLDDIIGNPMTKAEAKSIVNQILMKRKGGTKGFITFLNNGSSYGGGRRHTAQCIAGEAQIPMITVNARDFALKDIDALSMNANLSEIKIKKLFDMAKAQASVNKNKTAMIFIENFDNFASNPLYGVSSIYEQKAFSQLLEEMDKLRDQDDVNIVVIGSLNYPNLLDENVMKPYKFLDQIVVYSPQDNHDREDVLRYYADKNGLKIGETPEEKDKILKNASETTMGFSVVDIIYLLEKAEQVSKERGKEFIDKADITEAFLQTTTGRPSSREYSSHRNAIVAKHECGHALTLQVMHDIAKKENKPWHLPDKINFITLDPRGNYGGAMYPKDSENEEYSFEKVFSEIVCDFGGYSSEKRFYNMQGSWGITQDMSMATEVARLAVEKMGMGAKTGRISINSNPNWQAFISDSLKDKINSDVEVMLKNAEYVSNEIVSTYADFIEQFGEKYQDKVGTGECIIMSDEFQEQLENWKNSLSWDKKQKLLELENKILDVIEKTKKGELVKQ